MSPPDNRSVDRSAERAALLDRAELDGLQRWRKSVVRSWVTTMLAALIVWTAVTAFQPPMAVELTAALVLVVLVGLAVRNMRRGRCPRCGHPIRFQPRIELPRRCAHCSAPFS